MLREERQDRGLHGHVLSIIIYMIDTAVHNTHIDSIIFLLIHNPGQIVTAGCGQKPPHLKDQFIGPLLLKELHEFLQKTGVLLKIILCKIRHAQSGTKFQNLCLESFFCPKPLRKVLNISHFPGDLLHDFLLGAGKILKSHQLYMGISFFLTDAGNHILLAHAELIATCYPKNQFHLFFKLRSTALYKL